MGFWANLWDVTGWFLSFFILFAYLMVLFSIFGDLFRDRTMRGWAKALWVIFLIVVPILTALVYLIARGGGMTQRQQRDVTEAQNQADEYIRKVAGSSPVEEIARAKALLDSGAITQGEFDSLKARALA